MSEPPLPRHIAEHIKYWHPVYTSIVHRSEAVTLRRPPLYPPGYAIPTHLSNPAPFPFNLDPTTNCSLLLLFVLLLHSSLQTGHLFQQTPLLFHILSRVTITFLASILSTFLFEILGELLTQRLQTLSQKIRDIVSEFLVRRFEWGDLDQDNNPVREDDEGGDIVLRADPAFLHEPVREAVSGGIILTIHYLTTLLLRLFNDLISIHLSHPLLTLSLPLPPESSTTSQTTTTTSLLENLLPLLIQSTILLPLLWLTFSLFLARAERFALPGQYGHAIDDPKSSLFAHLVRATTMHLIAYTAYQAVVLVTPSIYPRIPSFLKMNSPFLSKLFPKASPLPAVLIFFLHYFLRHLSSFIAKNARGIFIPYLRWFTPLTEDGATSLWPALIHPLDEEMNVLDPGKRVISRVVMTALFGLESSWPARYHLSNLVPDD
ncbi:hypothetical protein GGS20DRAFT_562692 [Poronia punctata]|nr:hypothetical protein GGS20DRAFT_562692 [Poronia punctata]